MADLRLKDRYALGRFPLAHHGMGEVWPARDILLERDVIVKVIAGSSMEAELVRRFRREALLTARLAHPGVPAVFDLGEHKGRPYLVLERIDGVPLDDLAAEQHPLPVGWVAAIGAQISSVLIAALRINLVHRDLKPSNAMLERSGAVKVLDFGLAAAHGDGRYSRITQSGQILGTAGYMAPEQIYGEPADHRSDLYGLGGTLFHLLTGQAPFDGSTTTTTERRQLSDPPPRPSHFRPDTPRALDDLVHALLAGRPEDRPANAVEVYDALAPLVGPLPPIPGVVDDSADSVRRYSAIVGQRPQPPIPAPRDSAAPAAFDVDNAAEEVDRLFATGRYRAAARLCRELADEYARRNGSDHPRVFDWRLRAAHAHAALGEVDRARRQLDLLREEGVRTYGVDHPATRELDRRIASVRATIRQGPTVGR